MNLNEIFFEFSNKERYDVFKSLYYGKRRHSQLEKELNIPGPEISRHLSRLLKRNLINKTDDKNYGMTGIGRIFFRVMEIFETSLKHEQYYNTHDINIIPLHFILQLGTLKSIETSDKTMKNIETWSRLVKDSEKFVFAISDQFQDSLLPIVEKKINHESIDVKALIEENVLQTDVKELLKDRHAFYEKIDMFKNIRVLGHLDFSLIVSDKGAILFLSKDEKIDYSECIIDESEAFINWTIELFEWYWKKGARLDAFIKKKYYSKNE